MKTRQRIIIATTHVPLLRGGAEIAAEGLRDALLAEGHAAELVAVPFSCSPGEISDHMLACRLLDMTESLGTRVDHLIALKFPAWLIPHPNRILWILHQYRSAYDLWSHPVANGLVHYPDAVSIRNAIWNADQNAIAGSRAVFSISRVVSERLQRFNGLYAAPLYHPPHQPDLFYRAPAEEYLFFPSRLNPLKRQDMVLEALSRTRHPVRVRFAGVADARAWDEHLRSLADRLNLGGRVQWMGYVGEDCKRSLYAHCLAVLFPPLDEDYGYVTLEAMLSSKAVITCTDSGGPLEFVRAGETARVEEPTPDGLAAAMDLLWEDRSLAGRMGRAARDHYLSLGISWKNFVNTLLQ